MKTHDNSIAVLITCHNRKIKTIECLDSLFKVHIPTNFTIKVFVVDDGSIDGTADEIRFQFPQVEIISGTGNLFWNKGMRLAWESATLYGEFDFFLWLNDDTLISKNSLKEILDCYEESTRKNNRSTLIVGACCASYESEEFSYGGRSENGPIIPNGQLQECKYINGNVVLVPSIIFNDIGNLSPDYTHAMGDIDYGLRAIDSGYKCYTTKNYISICLNDNGIPAWSNPEIPIKKRWELLHSPKGLNIKEYNVFRKKFWGWRWIIYAIKAYIRVIFPNLKTYFG